MQPIVDIQPVLPRVYTYSVGAAGQAAHACGHFFETADDCLRDAGRGLAAYFEDVQVRFAGFALGSYSVARLVEEPMAVFEEILERVAGIYRQRSMPRGLRSTLGAQAATT